MNELTNTNATSLTLLNSLAEQARGYCEAVVTNTILLGKVLCEARELVAHGHWAEWVSNNTHMCERSAQYYIAIWKRFGGKSAYEGIDKTKLLSLNRLPQGMEDDFIEQNDVASMTSRQVADAVKAALSQEKERARKELEDAVKNAREQEQKKAQTSMDEMGQKLKSVTRERDKAQSEMKRMSTDDAYIPKEVRERITQLQTTANNALNELKQANILRTKAQDKLDETDLLLSETQKQLDATNAMYHDLQSTISKGDAERVPSDELDIDSFTHAVNAFIGACALMPHMQNAFAGMSLRELNEYEMRLATIEDWCKASRKAMSVEVIS